MSLKLKGNGTINHTVNTVDDLANISNPEVNDICIVTDENRGGTFIYRGTGTDDSGTIFSGWHRQYDGAVNVKWFSTINDSVLFLASNNGGILDFDGINIEVSEPILIVSGIKYLGNNAVITTASNINAFETGYYLNNAIYSNVSEWGTGSVGAGTHNVEMVEIQGFEVHSNATCFRLHRFNYNSIIKSCKIYGSDYSIDSSHGWGQTYRNNLIYTPMRLYDFVDWTVVEQNSFEGMSTETALTIGRDQQGGETTYGGSYTLKISNNGFHGNLFGIRFNVQCEGTEITGNHFECQLTTTGITHIIQDTSLTCSRFRIENNHIASTTANTIGIKFKTVNYSSIRYNDYTIAATGSWNKKVILADTTSSWNNIETDTYSTTNTPNLTYFDISPANMITVSRTNPDITSSQPFIDYFNGDGYTFEKYQSIYRHLNDKIPLCTVSKTTTSIIIDTFIDYNSTYGLFQPVIVYLEMAGSLRNYKKTAMIAGNGLITYFQDVEVVVGGGAAMMTVSGNSGKMRLTITSTTSDTYYARGFVKAL